MNILSRSIVLKLWLAMVAFVLIVLYFTGMAQTVKLKDLYYRQQLEQLTAEAGHIESGLNLGDANQKAHFLAVMAGALNSNIMVTDIKGTILYCVGMGMDMTGVEEEKINIVGHHGMPWKESDFNSILQGKVVSYRGNYYFLDSDVLTVAAPLYKGDEINGAVMLSAALGPIEERVRDLQRVTQYAGLAGIMLATILSLLFSRTLSRPLIRMNQAARAMARGDYSRRVEAISNDEIGLLAQSLNSLATRLQEKIAALERQDQIRREFVSNVSHELRTPLSIMQGYTEALIDGMAGSKAESEKYLGNIHEEILRLRRLVLEILDLQKMEAGRVIMDVREVSLTEVAGRVAGKLQPLADKKKIKLSRSFARAPRTIWGDPDRLEQVMINLLDNAIRVTPAGGEVKIEVMERPEEIVVAVSDDGPGIPPEEQALIWERFYKVDKSRTRTGGGTGLGLAIVKEIVEAHGGMIEVISEPGEGSVFSFAIPKRGIAQGDSDADL
ncbi:MAG: sensor histidine kinase [Eubacteriales bacterium]